MKLNLIISILSIFIVTSYAYTSRTYYKSDNDETISPIGGGYFVLSDGSKMFRFYRSLNDTCNEPDLHLRILQKDGTLIPFEVKNFKVPDFNFCRLSNSPNSPDYVQISKLKGETPNFYIFYYNISDSDHTLPFGRFVAQINMKGEIISTNWLGYVNYFNGFIVGRLGKFKKIYDSYYYIRLVDIHDPNTLSWEKFSLTPITGELRKEDISGIVTRENLHLQYDNPIYSFDTVDNGLGFIYSKNFSQVNTEMEPSLYVFVNYFKPEINKFTEPFIIYQTSTPNVIMKAATCIIDTTKIGYQCVLQLRKITNLNPVTKQYDGTNFVLLVSFLSSGSVTGIKKLSGAFLTADIVIKQNLPTGGYLLMYRRTVPNNPGTLIDGQIFNAEDIFFENWDVPNNFIIPFPYVVIYNSIEKKFEIVSEITKNSITIISSYFPQFNNKTDDINTMEAARIISIDPPHNTNISLGTNALKITYDVTVSLSTRNITIYQIVDDKQVRTRQITSGQLTEFCSIDQSSQIVTVNTLSSTFSIPNSEYHIYIGSNFVRYNETDEPINKLPHSSWILRTGNIDKEPYADSFSGSIRLTSEGTKIYKSNQKDFTDKLLQEISITLPVDLERLISKGPTQTDTSTPSGQMIIPLKIDSTRDPSKRNADVLHNDLDIMIRNKEFTEIYLHKYTSLLDENYGYKLKVDIKDIFQENKESLIAIMIILSLLIVSFLWAKRKNSKGNNIIIFKIGLSIVDFVLDGLFIFKNARDISIIFIPSLAIFAFSTLFDLIAAFSLIISENSRNIKFHKWFRSNPIVTAVFTLLSATNIEVLNILSSKFAGLKMFSAEFSAKTESLIFWFGILNFIVEDIPQFIIQVYYKTHIVSYSIIPFLALVTSGLMIAFNIIGKLYNSIIQCQKNRHKEYHGDSESKNGDDDDDDGKDDHKKDRNSNHKKDRNSNHKKDRNGKKDRNSNSDRDNGRGRDSVRDSGRTLFSTSDSDRNSAPYPADRNSTPHSHSSAPYTADSNSALYNTAPRGATYSAAPYSAPHNAPHSTPYSASSVSYNAPYSASHNTPYGASHNVSYGASHNTPYGASHNAPYGASHNAPSYNVPYNASYDRNSDRNNGRNGGRSRGINYNLRYNDERFVIDE